MSKKRRQILDCYREIIGRLVEEQKRPQKFSGGHVLYPSEISTLLAIGASPGLSVTELSLRGGVTKGAVSQTLNRLEKKGLIERKEDPSNLSRARIVLTAKGKKRVKESQAHYRSTDRALHSFFNSLSSDEIEILERFFAAVEKGINKRAG